jgi:hypothetical protein
LRKQSGKAVTAGEWRSKKLQNVVWTMDEPRLLEFPQGFLQNFSFGQNARRRVCPFWSVEAAKLGLEMQKNPLNIIC